MRVIADRARPALTIRDARPEDWPAIWPFFARSSFMANPQRAGHGVGRALGEDMIEWARERGFRAIQFNAVVETNERAVALWRSLGFEVVGTVPQAFDHPRHGYVGLLIMHRFV